MVPLAEQINKKTAQSVLLQHQVFREHSVPVVCSSYTDKDCIQESLNWIRRNITNAAVELVHVELNMSTAATNLISNFITSIVTTLLNGVETRPNRLLCRGGATIQFSYNSPDDRIQRCIHSTLKPAILGYNKHPSSTMKCTLAEIQPDQSTNRLRTYKAVEVANGWLMSAAAAGTVILACKSANSPHDPQEFAKKTMVILRFSTEVEGKL
jgi:hypothetical protein